MNRRLYYLLPDTAHADQLGAELAREAIPSEHIHAVIRQGEHVSNIADVHYTDEIDKALSLEWWLWRINLGVFFVALTLLLIMLVWQPSLWVLLPVVVMAATFIAGLMFVLRIPDVHLDEFKSSVGHGEVLMMVDVPVSQLKEVNSHICHHHAGAVNGGVCWHV